MRHAKHRVTFAAVFVALCLVPALGTTQRAAADEAVATSTELPSYPPLARAACVQGSVAILVDVDSEGRVTGTDVLYGHPLLRSVAENAAKKWHFASSGTVATRRRQVLRFSFRILPFEVPNKRLKPVFVTPTDVEIRSHPHEPSCDDCSPRREKQLRKGGCPDAH